MKMSGDSVGFESFEAQARNAMRTVFRRLQAEIDEQLDELVAHRPIIIDPETEQIVWGKDIEDLRERQEIVNRLAHLVLGSSAQTPEQT